MSAWTKLKAVVSSRSGCTKLCCRRDERHQSDPGLIQSQLRHTNAGLQRARPLVAG
jgi:hypothetical protein